MSLASNQIPDLHLVGAGAGTQCLPLYRYIPRPDRSPRAPGEGESSARNETKVGQSIAEDLSGLERVENITDWALGQFQKHYGKGGRPSAPTITKEDIFHYVYAVLHHPAYRAKYEINLKREFPRIPFYEDFHQWAERGKRLMDLHLNYESVQPFKLERRGTAPMPDGAGMTKTGRGDSAPACRLIARKEQGIIEIDTQTALRGVPAEAWEYRLGTYSALEWILERYKEKKPKDPTIAEKFNTYRFADYKEKVIDLLERVCTVSVETMKILKEMP
jgi:predicted helicase